jgi:hypothetical protein
MKIKYSYMQLHGKILTLIWGRRSEILKNFKKACKKLKKSQNRSTLFRNAYTEIKTIKKKQKLLSFLLICRGREIRITTNRIMRGL